MFKTLRHDTRWHQVLTNTTVRLSRLLQTSQISKAVKTKSLVETAILLLLLMLWLLLLLFLSDCFDKTKQGHSFYQTFEEKTSNKRQAGSKLHSHVRHLWIEAAFHTEKKKSLAFACITSSQMSFVLLLTDWVLSHMTSERLDISNTNGLVSIFDYV